MTVLNSTRPAVMLVASLFLQDSIFHMILTDGQNPITKRISMPDAMNSVTNVDSISGLL